MLNTVVLIGRLTRDPELRYTSQGTAVVNFGIAVDRGFKNTQNEQQTADFFNIVCWNRLAEIVAQYMTKGRLVAVQGRMQSRTVDRDGQRRTYIEVVASTVKFLERPSQNSFENYDNNYAGDPSSNKKDRGQQNKLPNQNYHKAMNFNDEEEDDLPF